jgi:hypothetical protein
LGILILTTALQAHEQRQKKAKETQKSKYDSIPPLDQMEYRTGRRMYPAIEEFEVLKLNNL